MEKCANPGASHAAAHSWLACSACAGDYEDPERSTGGPDDWEEVELEVSGADDE